MQYSNLESETCHTVTQLSIIFILIMYHTKQSVSYNKIVCKTSSKQEIDENDPT